MDLYLWRHGKAEENSSSGRDRDRELLPIGRAEVRSGGLWLKNQNETIDKIFTSPYARAEQTARILQEILAPSRTLTLLPALASAHDFERQLAAIQSLLAGAQAMVCVGHMPDLGHLTKILGNLEYAPRLATGGVAKIRIDPEKESGELVYLRSPEDF
jgi:phosphohistidine phosphatase